MYNSRTQIENKRLIIIFIHKKNTVLNTVSWLQIVPLLHLFVQHCSGLNAVVKVKLTLKAKTVCADILMERK